MTFVIGFGLGYFVLTTFLGWYLSNMILVDNIVGIILLGILIFMVL